MKIKSILLASCLLLIFLAAFKSQSAATTGPAAEPVVGLNLGNVAPEIEQSNPQGKTVALSSLRGKLVLIDFWASWCGPCRHENPVVRAAYDKFKDQKFGQALGFTVYSVSLDVNPQAWLAAIATDGLVWDSHVSDLQGWNSAPAALYGVTGIPVNYLVNERGIIISKNLRGNDLLDFLEKLSKK